MTDPFDYRPDPLNPIQQLQEIARLSYEINEDKLYCVHFQMEGNVSKWSIQAYIVSGMSYHIRICDYRRDEVLNVEGRQDDQKQMDFAIKKLEELLSETR
jgi:hypothetical protein